MIRENYKKVLIKQFR